MRTMSAQQGPRASTHPLDLVGVDVRGAGQAGLGFRV